MTKLRLGRLLGFEPTHREMGMSRYSPFFYCGSKSETLSLNGLFLLNVTAKADSKINMAVNTRADENSGITTLIVAVALLDALLPAASFTINLTV